ncbi:MAG: hypothetical protein ACKO3M_12855 [Rubrivivax sp.]
MTTPTPAAMRPEHWPPELRTAVAQARPEFTSWPEPQQLRWRTQLPADDREAIVTALLRLHGERRPAAQARLESHGRVSHALLNRINEWLQPLKGIGEDSFSLSECFADGQGILDFRTLRDYDEADHRFQESARQQEHPGYTPEPYSGRLYGTWARALVHGRLCYLTLTMAAAWLLDAADEAARVELDRLVPPRHVPGPEHGQRDGRGYVRWDMRVDAGGLEALHDALQRRIWDELARRGKELAEAWAAREQVACWLNDAPYEHEPADEQNLRVIFSGPEALSAVRLGSFLRDCRRIARPRAEKQALREPEAERMRHYVARAHEALRATPPA